MRSSERAAIVTFALFFVVSGFASLVDEVVWLRLAMASFGVTTPLASIVLSVFMAGLAIGSVGGGRLGRAAATAGPGRALVLYAVAELVIGASALVVPIVFGWGRSLLSSDAWGAAWGSSGYYLASAGWIGITLLLPCAAMGATFPLAMAALRAELGEGEREGFSRLYAANVLGATLGTLAAALVLIETLGFRGTLAVAAALNIAVAVAAFARSRRVPAVTALAMAPGGATADATSDMTQRVATAGSAISTAAGSATAGAGIQTAAFDVGIEPAPRAIVFWLFLSGLVSMGMELVWLRLFSPFLGTLVYTFAAVLAVYLAATFAGSWLYRRLRAGGVDTVPVTRMLWLLVGLMALLALAAADPRMKLPALVRLGGIVPFCAAVGFLTPMLVDRWSRGAPDRAGRAYAANVVGSIVGPPLAGFLLLPALDERTAVVLLALPLFAGGLAAALAPWLVAAGGDASRQPGNASREPAGQSGGARRPPRSQLTSGRARSLLPLGGAVLASLAIALTVKGPETKFPGGRVMRDHTATVIAVGQGMNRGLIVNGDITTVLTPLTKMMAHLPLALLDRQPKDGLVICFGMGTTFRSMLAWDVNTTVVELVPSVPKLFDYFHADAEAHRRSPLGRVVIDDGRRFLERSTDRFDVITVDPPYPVEAAGSSLLYSREFYEAAKRRLRPGGIVQQWIPNAEDAIVSSVARAFGASFPHVRTIPWIRTEPSVHVLGIHFIGSMSPIPMRAPAELVARMPARAVSDLVEWDAAMPAQRVFELILAREVPIRVLYDLAPEAPMLEDDRPFNEYFLVRRWFTLVPGV